MTGDQLAQQLMRWVAALDRPLGSLTPREGLDLIARLFEAAPAGSELTCSWAVPMWGRLEHEGDEFRVTCWVGLRPERPDATGVRTLSLAFRPSTGHPARDCPEWLAWCNDPADLADFRASAEASPALRAIEDVDNPGYARIDEWGVGLFDESYDSWFGPFASGERRDRAAPEPAFTEAEWLESDDAPQMLRWLRRHWTGDEADLDRLLSRYYLACCRRIWPLLPQEWSRAGVEVAERFLEGLATKEELSRAEWLAEGAGFHISYNIDPEAIARWCREVARIPREELEAMLHEPRKGTLLVPRGLLMDAAGFVDYAMIYPRMTPKDAIDHGGTFLPAPLLREVVGNPFR